jgi:hypothetical protein
LPWRVALQIGVEACRALRAAHAARLIHRDVKPANLLVSPEGDVKLTDFGLAKALSGEQAPLTRPNAIAGSPNYMSPEQVKGETLDERTDIYSLGATMYALLTGAPPFADMDWYSTMYAHATQQPPNPRQRNAAIPDNVVKVLDCAMAKRRSDRYPDVAQLQQALEACLGPQREALGPLAAGFALPSAAELPGPTVRVVRRPAVRVSRRRLLAAMLGLAFALATATLALCIGVAVWVGWPRTPPPVVVSPDQLKRDLQARNPNFAGDVQANQDRNGHIVRLKLIVDDVTDIAPLAALVELEELELTGSEGIGRAKFTDVTPLATLTKLKHLRIRICKVTNIDALQHLTALRFLDLGATDISDLRALRDLAIAELRVGGTRIRDVRGLENLPLQKLYLGYNYSLKSLDGLPTEQLRWLSIVSTDVSSLRPLEKADCLEYLNFALADLTHNYPKNKDGKSLSDDNFQIVLARPALKTVGGEFTAQEEKLLQERRPGLICLKDAARVSEFF